MQSENKKVAIVTGANRGIGYETCRQLSQLGIITILTSRNKTKGEQAVVELSEGGGELLYHQLDVAKTDSITRLKKYIIHNFQRCDILVNNAGVFLDRGVSILNLQEDTLL